MLKQLSILPRSLQSLDKDMITGKIRVHNEWSTSVSHCYFSGPGDQGGNTYYVSNEVFKGQNYDNWQQRLKEGLQCTTNLDGTKYTSNGSAFAGLAVQTYNSPDWNCINFPILQRVKLNGVGVNLPFEPPFHSTTLETADNIAKRKFVEKAKEIQTSFQGGVFLGELGETLHMLASPAKSLRQGLSSYLASLKKRKRQVKRVSPRKRLHTAAKIASDTWLEYSFGWKPFLSDIDDATRLLAESGMMTLERWKPISAIGKDEQTSFWLEPVVVNSFFKIQAAVEGLSSRQVVYRGQVDVVQPRKSVWNSSGNFFEDFVPTVWELIPYSFLVDYFTNIGDIINAASFIRSKIRWMARTERSFYSVRVVDTLSNAGTYSNFYTTVSIFSGDVHQDNTKTVISRRPYTGSLVPSFEFQLPNLGTKWINMAALLIGQRNLVPFHR